MDQSRPLTFASDHRNCELCFDLADIVSLNLYPLWYGNEDTGEICDAARGWAERSGTKNSKGIVAEYRRPKLVYSVVQKYYKNR